MSTFDPLDLRGQERAKAEADERAYREWRNSWPKSWPNLVGDCPARASAIVRFNTEYFTVCLPYKIGRKAFKERLDTLGHNPVRVILYLDDRGFVAVTPRVG